MFKISKLCDTTNESVVINGSIQDIYEVPGNRVIDHNLVLNFDIFGILNGDRYSLHFDFSFKPKLLLNLESSYSLDYKEDKLDIGDLYFNYNDCNGVELQDIDIKITKINMNKFVIYINFITDDYYSGIIEFDFKIDDYIDLDKGIL